jgi:tRNA dimethylallyltransferase
MMFAASRPGVEIVNADSRQLYRGMDIGTAKPSPRDRALVPHHLLDVAFPDTLLSAGWFAGAALKAMEGITLRGGLPVAAGGSPLYIMAMTGMMDPLPQANPPLRKVLKEMEEDRPGTLQRMLSVLDPGTRVGSSDRVRQIRALEIILGSGERASDLRRGSGPREGFVFILLEPPLEALRKRMDDRVDMMMEQGLLEEVEGLLSSGFRREPVMGRTIGYREMLDHLEGRCSLDQAVSNVKINTWRFARRQRNMLERLPGTLRAGSPEAAVEILDGRWGDGKG